MDQLMYFFMILTELIIPLIGWITIFTAPWLIPFVYFRIFPKTARTFIAAKRKNMIPALIVHDSGRGVITLMNERMGGGICVTEKKNKYKILPRFIEGEDVSEEAEKAYNEENSGKENPEKSLKLLVKTLGDWVTKRCHLVGLGKPMFVGYSGKACLLNPLALALWEAGKMKIRNEEHKFIRKKVPDDEGKIPKIQELLQPLMLLDPRSAKAVISHAFDEAQIAAMCADSEEIGRLGRGLPKWVLPIGIILIVVVAGAALFLLLSGAAPLG